MSNELERLWKEVDVTNLRSYPQLHLQRLGNTKKIFSRCSRFLDRLLNAGLPWHTAGILAIWEWSSVLQAITLYLSCVLPYRSILISYKRRKVIVIVTRLRARRFGVRITAETTDFSNFQKFRPTLGPTQPPIQWLPKAISLAIKRLRREADH